VVVMLRGLTMVMDRFATGDVLPRLSLTVTLKENVPVVEPGVPLITPVAEFRVRPPGSDPAVSVQVKGPVPPVTTKVAE
jgi:hypothetical protein